MGVDVRQPCNALCISALVLDVKGESLEKPFKCEPS